jgi:nucleoside-diphosphate-sugar epimerase
VADALDEKAVEEAVLKAAPEAVVHQLTSLPQRVDPRKIERDFALNDKLRAEGTHYLVAAAQAAGASRLLAQSIAFLYASNGAGALHSEQDPILGEDAPKAFKRTALAVGELERTVIGAGGIVLRYGYFYGPGTWIAPDGSIREDLQRRRFPIVGDGSGVWSFIHIDDAAAATVRALAHGGSGTYNIVDDDPAPVAQWLPELARLLDAPRPMKVPKLLGRVLAGEYAVRMMTAAQGASNARAKRDLGWEPRHPSWRDGFPGALA